MFWVEKNSKFAVQFFQLLSKDLPTRLTHLRFLLCQVCAFFLTLALVYLVRLLDFSLQGYGRCFDLINSNAVDLKECAYFTISVLILIYKITILKIEVGKCSLDKV